ncbi:MAG: hypothetical protein KDE35_14630 [Geminicoccaceae bacterium]|nr:hypothetical protein [Geminicoccaceae bacterium]
MSLTDVDICSMALLKIGAAPIAGFDDPSAEAEIAGRLYEAVVEGLLVAHPWAFSTAQAALVPDTVPPTADFAHAYALPADLLRTLSAGSAGRARGVVYRIQGDRLLSDVEPVVLTYQRRPATSAFPPHFVQVLVARLAAEFCIPVTESTSRADMLHKLAQAEVKLARLVDSQQMTPQAVEDFTLIRARG